MDADVIEPTPPAKPDRTLLAILIVVGLLVVLALVVVLVRSTVRDSFDPTTPEGVVQRYAQAVIDGDEAAAGEYLASRPEECDYYDRGTADLRLTLRSSEITGSNATVRVSVSTSYSDDPYSNYEYTTNDQFTLVQSGGSWLIEQMPYDFISCDTAGSNQ